MPETLKSLSRAALALVIFVHASCSAFAGGGPESVLVVVNAGSDSSKLIANTYISLRGIPGRNVVYLDDIPFKEAISFEDFENKILRPVLGTIEDRKLSGSIDYIVYSADFPTTVRMPAQRKKFLEALEKRRDPIIRAAKDNWKRLFNGEASITSLTYMASRSIVLPEAIFELQSNRYFRGAKSAMLRTPFLGSLQKEFQRSISAFRREPNDPLFESAISSLEQMAKSHPGQTAVLYWLAKFNAKRGDAVSAIRWMTRAVGMGWSDRSGTAADPTFSSIKDSPEFAKLLKRMGSQGSQDIASRGFRQLYRWGPNGMINGSSDQGERYFLSTVLAVTRNDGNTEAEAVRQLSRSVGADFTRPRGKFYFMKGTSNKDPRTSPRVSRFNAAMIALQDSGYLAEVIAKKPLPEERQDILGITSGTAKFDVESSRCRILPGAICENLTSFGGRMGQIGGQTKLSEFLRFGAAGSCGAVIEPMNLAAKFPDPMIHAHYVRGCSLAEAFYQSLRGPFHMLIVGDALCQPFAVQPQLVVTGIEPMATVSGEADLQFDRSRSPVRISGMELYLDGIMSLRDNKFEPISIDSNLLPDGYHEMRIVAFAANLIETRSSVVIPLIVDNEGLSCELSADRQVCGFDDALSFTFSATGASKIQLFQHRRKLGEVDGATGTVEIKAKTLGRGKTRVRAVAFTGGKEVSSVPIEVQVNGSLSDTRPRTAKPKAKLRAKPKAKKQGGR